MKANRYTIEIGKYGAYIYDNKLKEALPLDIIVRMLNIADNNK